MHFAMRDTTFTELRNHAKDYFGAIEGGDKVRIFRNGKPVAEIVPCVAEFLSGKDLRRRLKADVPAIVVSLLESHPLHAMNAIHVACALAAKPDVFVSADRRHRSTARKAGLKTADFS